MAETPTLSQKIARVAGFIGLALMLPWYAASGLVAPGWAVIILLGVWVALLAVGIVLWRTRPALVLAVPLVAAVVWVALVSAGDAWLGWTA